MKENDTAISPPTAILLLVVLTLLLATILLILCMGMVNAPLLSHEPIPEIITIKEIHHEDEKGKIQFSSRLHLIHKGFEPEPILGIRSGMPYLVEGKYPPIRLSDHYAVLYVNGIKMNAFITTLNGHDFISTHHYGVSKIQGIGIRGEYWNPGETAWFDFADQMITENDEVTLEIIRKSDGKIISRSVKTAPVIPR